MTIAGRRFGLRLPFEHPVYEAYRATEEELDVRGNSLDAMFLHGFYQDEDNSIMGRR
jgi:hypothetical protein